MATWRVNNATVLGNFVCAQWVPNTVYALGDRVVCSIAYGTTARRAFVYECTTAGTSHAATEPVWPTSGTIADGPDTLVWTTRSPNDGTWANASCLLLYMLCHAAAAGDFIYLDDGHSESSALYLYASPGTHSSPVKIICVDKATDALSTGAIVNNSSAYTLRATGVAYSYGIKYSCTTTYFELGRTTGGTWILEGGDVLSGAGLQLYVGNSAELIIINGNVNILAVGNSIGIHDGKMIWLGGTLTTAGDVGVTALVTVSGGNSNIVDFRDINLENVGNGAVATSLLNVVGKCVREVNFSRCKLPSDAGFAITSGSWTAVMRGLKAKFHHCSSANKTYDFLESCYEGTIEDETTIVRDGGASDGTTPQSWKMVSSANTVDNINPLISPPIQSWTESTTSKTFTVECIVDSAANLQNDEVWMEFEYPINNTDGLGGFARDKCAMLGAPADKSTSAVTWNGTGGMANPNKFKCAVTVTPGKKGPITARICLAKASTTIYVDPLVTES